MSFNGRKQGQNHQTNEIFTDYRCLAEGKRTKKLHKLKIYPKRIKK